MTTTQVAGQKKVRAPTTMESKASQTCTDVAETNADNSDCLQGAVVDDEGKANTAAQPVLSFALQQQHYAMSRQPQSTESMLSLPSATSPVRRQPEQPPVQFLNAASKQIGLKQYGSARNSKPRDGLFEVLIKSETMP